MSKKKRKNRDIAERVQMGILREEIDKTICSKCGKKRKLTIHHIKKQIEFPEKRFNKNNCVLLCQKCHSEVHKIKKEKKILLLN